MLDKHDYLYYFDMSSSDIRKMKIAYTILWLMMTATTVLAGMIETKSSAFFFVTVPYALMIIPLGLMALSCFNTVFMVDVMVYKTYHRSVERLYKVSRMLLMFDGVCLGGEIIFIAFNYGNINVVNEVMFLAGIVIALIANVVLVVLQKKYTAHIVMIKKESKHSGNMSRTI